MISYKMNLKINNNAYQDIAFKINKIDSILENIEQNLTIHILKIVPSN